MNHEFAWIDVFAQHPLTGNPLPVVPNADDLSIEQMRAITREFNQSETTFLVSPTVDGADYRLRSFTVDGTEVLGAGHNAMGAWIWLASSGRLPQERTTFAQQIGDDVLDVKVDRDASRPRVTMRQSPPRFRGGIVGPAQLASALRVASDAFAAEPAEVVSTGVGHLLVPVYSRETVDAVDPDASALRALLAAAGGEGCYVYSTEHGQDDTAAYARFFNPTVGIVEDPATGTAAGPLAARLVRDGHAKDGVPIRIEQGRAVGRPSILELLVDGDVVELSGSGLLVAEGKILL